jgi:SM-20-related protein
MTNYVNLEQFRNQALEKEPFPHLVMPGFVKAEVLDELVESYPKLDKPGSFPLPGLTYGEPFARMVRELEGPEVRKAFEDKFQIDLSNRPTMITARCMCRARDGKIHTDSRSKIITVLIYLNRDWENLGGCLRLLRSPNLEDYIAEVPPVAGTLISFLNTENAWHGHASYEGPRRAIQLNWVTDEGVVKHEQTRHRFSAMLKKLNPF